MVQATPTENWKIAVWCGRTWKRADVKINMHSIAKVQRHCCNFPHILIDWLDTNARKYNGAEMNIDNDNDYDNNSDNNNNNNNNNNNK